MKRFKLKRRKGFNLIEIMIGISIASILMGAIGTNASKNVKRSNRDAVTNEMQIFLTGISDAYYNLGAPSFDPNVASDVEEFKKYLQRLQADYLSASFDLDSVQPLSSGNGFSVTIAAPLDIYESPYQCWFVTNDAIQKYAMIVSGGDDGIVNAANYSTQGYGDDIVLVVQPKI